MDETERLRRALETAGDELRACQEQSASRKEHVEALKRDLRSHREELYAEEMHSATLERLLDRAYARLEEAGLTEKIEFALSHEAIDVFEALPRTFAEEDVAEEARRQGCEPSRAEAFLGDYVRLGLVSGPPDGEGTSSKAYRKTGRTCWF